MKKYHLFHESRRGFSLKLHRLLLIMRLSLALLIVFSNIAVAGIGQEITIQSNNSSLVEILEQIESQSEYTFLYRSDLFSDTKLNRIQVRGDLEKILKKVLVDNGFGYRISDKIIVIHKLPITPEVPQQPVIARGKITDSNGQPLPGVNVVLQGTTRGTITNQQGEFELKLDKNEGILVFSYVGFMTKKEIYSGEYLHVTLQEDIASLNEVIVVGYGTQRKIDLTGAVASVKAEDLPKGVDASVSQLLQGKAAGVTVTATNALPGGGIDIRIRGAASTGAGNAPLYVIDGFPVSNNTLEPGNGSTTYSQGSRNPLNALNPNDIESIEILKDASATAIYGARAANGVILISTRRGKQGLQVTYDANYSMQKISQPFEMLSNQEYMIETNRVLEERWMRNFRIAPYGDTDPSTVTAYQPRFTEDEINTADKGTNWWDLVTRNGIVNNHNISLSAGNEKLKSFASFSYYDNQGVMENSSLSRYSSKLNLDWNINQYLRAGMSFLGSVVNNSNLQIGEGQWESTGMIMSALMYDPTIPVKDSLGNYNIMSWYSNMPNPVSYTDVDDQTKQTRNLLNLFAEIIPLENLVIRTALGYDGQGSVRKTYYPKTFLYGKLKNGQANIGHLNRDDILFDLTASYDLTADNHKFKFLAGYSFQEFNDDGYWMNATDFFTDAFLYNNMYATQKEPVIGSTRNKSVLASYFGRVNYNLKERYLLTFSARYDGSDKFGINNKWGFFPSVAVGWRVTEEAFMQNMEFISYLKLRASWGQTGNSNIGANALPFYDVNRKYAFNSNPTIGVSPGQLESPDLKWETTSEINFGLDFGFFENRIAGSLELYDKEVKDLLGWRNLRSWMLLPGVADNLGVTQGRGVELTLNTLNINTEIKWTSTFTFTRYVDRWKERSPDVVLQPWESVDDPVRAVFYYQTDGIVQAGETVPHMPNAIPGNMKVKDINGFDDEMNYTGEPDGKINEADIIFLGSSDPAFTLGINNTFDYKNFDLSLFGYGMFNRLIYNNTVLKYIGWSDKIVEHGTNLRVETKDRWSSDNQDGIYPSDAVNTTMGNDAWVYENASFFRIRNITLGYTFPYKILKKTISSLRIYLDVQNPFVITNWNGMDPETDGSSLAPYPNQKSFSAGVNIKF